MRKIACLSLIATFLSWMEVYSVYLGPVVPDSSEPCYVSPTLNNGMIWVPEIVEIPVWDSFVEKNLKGGEFRTIDLSAIDVSMGGQLLINKKRALIVAIIRNLWNREYSVNTIKLNIHDPIEWRTMLGNAFAKINALSSTTKDRNESFSATYSSSSDHDYVPIQRQTIRRSMAIESLNECGNDSDCEESTEKITSTSKSPVELGDSPTLPEEK